MDYLWSPWRYRYVQKTTGSEGCVFCAAAANPNDSESLIVHRGQFNFILLNLYPYTTGHMMVAPYEHVRLLELAQRETLLEMIELTRAAQIHLREVYSPDGFNVGMNMGAEAGAGVADHIHMHVLPRWKGDASFMTTIGETRVLPEDLNQTYSKLRQAFQGHGAR